MRHHRTFSTIVLIACLATIISLHSIVGASWLGIGLTSFLILKTVMARRFRGRITPPPDALDHHRVCIVMPLYNEDPGFAVASVRSMINQDRRPDRIHVVDDGSPDGGRASLAVEHVLRSEANDLEWEVTRLATNQGKRAALATGFRAAPDADIYVCVDSDTILDHAALAEGVRSFNDRDVAAVAGFVMAENWSRNVLTRMIDLRYVSAFLSERAAYSLFGAVLCCCGSLAFFRAEVIRDRLDDFLDQRFLGQVATFGDDRRLTNYALRAGRVVLCEKARASTAVPERFGHYLRQQIRWNKSFFRESVWVLGTFPLASGAFWLTLWEIVAWGVVGMLLMATFAFWPLMAHARDALPFIAIVPIAAYARCTAYLEDTRPSMRLSERIGIFALAPLYAVMHLAVLVPLRMWALLSLRRARWGTRESVEVRLAHAPPPAPPARPARTLVILPWPEPPVDWAIPILAYALAAR